MLDRKSISDFYNYLAGFFDGEGYAGCYKLARRNSFYWKLHAKIAQDEFYILNHIKRALGYGNITRNKDGYYHYCVNSAQARRFLRTLLPFLRSKDKIAQVKNALALDRKYVTPKEVL